MIRAIPVGADGYCDPLFSVKILVVEAESIVAHDVQDMLKSWGYVVPAIVSSGEKAIEKAAETQPDLVLMDVVLKGDMDGIDAAELIRARFDIPVVYLTAHASDNRFQRALMSELYSYILKPFDESELHTTIEKAIYKRNHIREQTSVIA
jgi:CheY-like chemotaxis protein